MRDGVDAQRVRAYKRWAAQGGPRSGGGGGIPGGIDIEDLFGGGGQRMGGFGVWRAWASPLTAPTTAS